MKVETEYDGEEMSGPTLGPPQKRKSNQISEFAKLRRKRKRKRSPTGDQGGVKKDETDMLKGNGSVAVDNRGVEKGTKGRIAASYEGEESG